MSASTVIGGFFAAPHQSIAVGFGDGEEKEHLRLFARAMLHELSTAPTLTPVDSRRIEVRYVLETNGRSGSFTFRLDASEDVFARLTEEFSLAKKLHALLTGKGSST